MGGLRSFLLPLKTLRDPINIGARIQRRKRLHEPYIDPSNYLCFQSFVILDALTGTFKNRTLTSIVQMYKI